MEVRVKILNKTLGVGEKISRIGNVQSASLFRDAWLSITNDKIQLTCIDDVGASHVLGSLPQQSIRRIKIKKSAFTPAQQLLKPAMSGAFVGIGLTAMMWFQRGNHPNSMFHDSPVIASIGMILFGSAVFVVFNLGKIGSSFLSLVVFESNDSSTIEVAVENEKADAIVAPFIERKIAVETL